uniref:histone acetyltransferase n=1 Tax=Kalanchoe fedtschenkoi TaxID=63787 RepID=A0A7N0UX03_KALFE
MHTARLGETLSPMKEDFITVHLQHACTHCCILMVLYHLHKPTAPAFVATCNICIKDIEAGQGWRCEICPEYDVCNSCYQKGALDMITPEMKKLDLLAHASQCRSALCQHPNCRKVKGLFRHGIMCKTRASGECGACKKMWYLLQLHARACKESECHACASMQRLENPHEEAPCHDPKNKDRDGV